MREPFTPGQMKGKITPSGFLKGASETTIALAVSKKIVENTPAIIDKMHGETFDDAHRRVVDLAETYALYLLQNAPGTITVRSLEDVNAAQEVLHDLVGDKAGKLVADRLYAEIDKRLE